MLWLILSLEKFIYLVLQEILKLSKAVMMVWMPGTEGGNAIADVIFGDVVHTGSLDSRIRELIAVTILATYQTLCWAI